MTWGVVIKVSSPDLKKQNEMLKLNQKLNHVCHNSKYFLVSRKDKKKKN